MNVHNYVDIHVYTIRTRPGVYQPVGIARKHIHVALYINYRLFTVNA